MSVLRERYQLNRPRNEPEIIRNSVFRFDEEDDHHGMGRNISTKDAFYGTINDIFKSDHYELSKLIRCMLKFAVAGAAAGAYILLSRHNTRSFENVIRIVNQKTWFMRRLAGYSMQGGAIGIAWYLWYHGLVYNHNNQSLSRYLMGHALFGGALSSYLFVPSAFPYGFAFSLIYAIGSYNIFNKPCGYGFEIKLPNYSEQKRNQADFEDSLKLLGGSSILVDHHQYVLPGPTPGKQ